VSALAEALPLRFVTTLARCGGCGEEVLRAPLAGSGLVVLLEKAEVIPRMPCPTCRSARLRDWDVTCWRCGDRQEIGVEMSGFGAAIGEDGLARPLQLARLRVVDRVGKTGEWLGKVIEDTAFEGQAIHRAHRCAP
jgi:hypothetical protein